MSKKCPACNGTGLEITDCPSCRNTDPFEFENIPPESVCFRCNDVGHYEEVCPVCSGTGRVDENTRQRYVKCEEFYCGE